MSSTHYNLADRSKVINWAHELFSLPNFYILDTETTGLDKQDEIVQIGIIDKHGEVVLDSLVKATKPLSSEVTRIHGISNAMLRDAPTLDELYVTLSAKLAGTPLIAYNMDFDWRMISQSLQVYKLPVFRTGTRHCAMKQYAIYRGNWNNQRRSYKWHSLSTAASYEDIQVKDAHTALGDVKMTLELLKKMASQDKV